MSKYDVVIYSYSLQEKGHVQEKVIALNVMFYFIAFLLASVFDATIEEVDGNTVLEVLKDQRRYKIVD